MSCHVIKIKIIHMDGLISCHVVTYNKMAKNMLILNRKNKKQRHTHTSCCKPLK